MSQIAVAQGSERAGLRFPSLVEMVREFSILREVLIKNLESTGELTNEERRLIHLELDKAIESAADEFRNVDRVNLEAELTDLKQFNVRLDNFAATTAHDLKSPLSMISGYAAELRELFVDVATAESEAWFASIEKSIWRIAKLVDSSLNFARLRGEADAFEDVDLTSVVLSVLSDLRSEISNVKAEVIYDELPTVFGDEPLLRQLFQNLIANALKFHESWPSMIWIFTFERIDHWIISIQDNGIGFDMKYSEEIFNVHSKIKKSALFGGAGLGLATCRRIVELHGYTISGSSRLRNGSVFTFGLPKPCAN